MRRIDGHEYDRVQLSFLGQLYFDPNREINRRTTGAIGLEAHAAALLVARRFRQCGDLRAQALPLDKCATVVGAHRPQQGIVPRALLGRGGREGKQCDERGHRPLGIGQPAPQSRRPADGYDAD